MASTFELLKTARLERAELVKTTGTIAEASYTRSLIPAESREFDDTFERIDELSAMIGILEKRQNEESTSPAKR